MNIEVSGFEPEEAVKKILPILRSEGTGALKDSQNKRMYDLSFREVFGLCVIANLRKHLDPSKKWACLSKNEMSDDGSIISFAENGALDYIENVEQIYLPGEYLKRDREKDMSTHILQHVLKVKNKGREYQKDISLLIFGDVPSSDLHDVFEWQIFTKKFYKNSEFLHLYFISLTGHTSDHLEYYLLSFTNQKHRQELNGEFKFKANNDRIFDFECTQKINLLDPPKKPPISNTN